MFRHVVMFNWDPSVKPGDIDAISAALDRLAGSVPTIRRYQHGPDAGVNEGNFDYVVVADFDSVDDYVVYRDSAAHVDFLRDYLTGRVASRAAVQYEVGT